MWELIRANKRNSIFLVVLMAVVLLTLGYVIGGAWSGYQLSAWIGMGIAAILWLILFSVSLAGGDQVLLAASKARRVTHDVHPQLFNVVEEMAIAANLPMPKVYIINDPAPNAFATGRSPKSASIAVTAGLLTKLNRDELQGVVAHEMSHILHRDILFITVAGIMLGAIVLLSQVFLRSMFWRGMAGGQRRYSSGGRGGGQAQLVMLLIAIVAAILAPLFAYLLYFAISRRREYLADAGSARLTRYPRGLADALEKISSDKSPQLSTANKVTAPMYIANPLKKRNQARLSDLSSTHPPISKRIKVLRSLSHGVSYKDYNSSYMKETGSKKNIIPVTGLMDKDVSARGPTAKGKPLTKPKDQAHQIGDLMRMVNGFLFVTCTCGLKFKVPPNYKATELTCPRCKRKVSLAQNKSGQRERSAKKSGQGK